MCVCVRLCVSVCVCAHGQWQTGARSEKTGAGDYFKLIVKILRQSSQGFFSDLEMYHLLSELLDVAVRTWAKAHLSKVSFFLESWCYFIRGGL